MLGAPFFLRIGYPIGQMSLAQLRDIVQAAFPVESFHLASSVFSALPDFPHAR
jgi:hypothetical protein